MQGTVEIFGVPMDLGSGRRGVDMGPSAIRYAGLADAVREFGLQLVDRGNLPVPLPESEGSGEADRRFVETVARTCERLADEVAAAAARGALPLILGGDHSLSIGSIGGMARGVPLGVLWLDAHGDFNTPATSPSGNVHGMPLASLLGLGDPRLRHAAGAAPLRPEQVAIVGARALDEGERRLLREHGVAVYSMEAIDRRGVAAVVAEAIDRVGRGTERLHVSLDLDLLDPREAPGVGTPVPGGMTYREAHLAMELVAEDGRLVSMDVVEVNPIMDDRNVTARLACELVLSALGRRIF